MIRFIRNNGSAGSALSAIFRFAPLALRNQPTIVVPFLVFAGIEMVFLILLYHAPREPFSFVLGPPIRVFFGERFLHYPENFLLLPALASFSRNVLYVVFGSVLNGVAVMLVRQAYEGRRRGKVLAQALSRYPGLASVSLLSTLVYMIVVRLMSSFWNHPLMLAIDLAAGIMVQACFIYAVPALMLNHRGVFRSLRDSLELFARMPLTTLLVVTVPALAYVPVMVFQYKTPFFVELYPESVLLIAVAGSLVNSLVVDVLVAVCVTYLYIKAGQR